MLRQCYTSGTLMVQQCRSTAAFLQSGEMTASIPWGQDEGQVLCLRVTPGGSQGSHKAFQSLKADIKAL